MCFHECEMNHQQRFKVQLLVLSLIHFIVCVTQADRSGPNFSTAYKNTEQMVNVSSISSLYCLKQHWFMRIFVEMITWFFSFVSFKVTFTSLDLMLHTEALLSAINFLSVALSSDNIDREIRPKIEDKMLSTKSSQQNTGAGEHTLHWSMCLS